MIAIRSLAYYYAAMPLEPKDIVTLVISGAAFALSSLSYFQKKVESTQSLRKRLTDILKELSDLNLKDATFRSLGKKDGYPPNYIGLLADQRRFFVREAASLSDSLGASVSPHEKNVIASTFDNMDYVEDADRFFKDAVEHSAPGIERGLASRNYGRFLYRQGLFAEGGTSFQQAIAAFSGDDDRNRFYRNSTYVRWAESEFNEKEDPVEARALLAKARDEADKLKSPRRRQRELNEIEKSSSAMFPASPHGSKKAEGAGA